MIKGKTIAIDARMIEMSGIGTYIQHLMNQGIYDYAFGREEEIRKYDPDVKVISFDAPIYKLKEQIAFPNRKVKENGISMVHFPHYNVPFSYKGRYVVTVHDLTHIVFPEFLGNRGKQLYSKVLMEHALNKAEHIFTVSENSKEDIIEKFGIDNRKISITYNAVDKEFRVRDKKEINYIYKRFNIHQDKRILLYVGNLKPHKNLDTLLRAFSEIVGEVADIELLLVGKSFTSFSIVEEERRLGIGDYIIHTGVVSKEELVDLYNLADIFVFPSLYEGFGIPPLEAMACGTPVIAADNSSIPEVVGNAAVLFDAKKPDELCLKIKKILGNPKMRDDLKALGFARCKCFSWKDTVDRVKSGIGAVV